MDTRSLLVVFTLLAVATSSSASIGRKAAVVGSYKPIKHLDDPLVVEIAKFAVNEHNKKQKAHLQYVKIIKGEEQVVSGKNYRLVITAKDGGAAANYQAVVYDAPWKHTRTLTSFDRV